MQAENHVSVLLESIRAITYADRQVQIMRGSIGEHRTPQQPLSPWRRHPIMPALFPQRVIILDISLLSIGEPQRTLL